MRILFLLLFPVFLSAQINNAYGVIEIGSFPTSSSTGPKFAYRPADSSFYRWSHGSTWVKVIEPSIMSDTIFITDQIGTSYVVSGDTINLTPYLLKSDTTAMLVKYIERGDTASMLTNYPTFGDVNTSLGNYLPILGGTLTGTGGAGFLGLPAQSGTPSTPAAGFRLFANGAHNLAILDRNGWITTFDISATANRDFTYPSTGGTFALGTGTADRSARWSATNTLAAGNITDNGTKLQSLLPWQFQTYTTAGLPSGVTGYTVYNTTTNGPAWYQGSRWAYGLESTFNRGTATYVPFFDANGQLTQAGANQGLRYYNAGSNTYILEAKVAIVAQGITSINSSNADIAVRSATGNGYWSFSANESTGGFSFYDAASAQFPVKIGKNSGTDRIVTSSTTTALSSSTLLSLTSTTVSNITGSNTFSTGTGLMDALGANSASLKTVNGSNIFSFSPFSTSPYLSISNGTQQGYVQATTLDGIRIGSVTNHPIVFVTNSTTKAYLTGAGRFGIAKAAPDYILDATSTDAYGIPRGTVAQRPTIVASTTPFRYNTDSTALEYGESVGTWRLLASREYARSLVSGLSPDTWLGTRLPTGDVEIASANNSLRLNSLDTMKMNNAIITSGGTNLLLLNPNVGSTGTAAGSYHTNINGTINGVNAGTGHIVIGGATTANGYNFMTNLGYTSLVGGNYAIGLGYDADATAEQSMAIGYGARADEDYEISLGSNNYRKLNLWTNTGDIFAKGDVIAEDSVKITTRPSMPSATDIAVYDASGWLGYRTISSISNGIYSGSATLANHTTRARVPNDGNLFFSQTYNGGADSSFFYFANATSGERYVGLGMTDTASTGGASLLFGNDGAGGMSFELVTNDAVNGNTQIRGIGGDLLMSSSAGNISLSAQTTNEVRVTGLVKAKQEAYYEITSTSSPQTFSNDYSDNFVNQGGTQASFTFLFPASPEDGQILSVTWNNAISVLTLDGNGNTITGTAVTTAVAGTRRQFKYYASASAWIKIY